MKTPKLSSLRYNIWFYFIIFALMLVGALWLMQVIVFDAIYQNSKFEALEEQGNEITAEFNTEGEVSPSTVNGWIKKVIEMAEQGYSLYLAGYSNGSLTSLQTIFSDSVGDGSDYSVEERKVVEEGIRQFLSGSDKYVIKKFDYENEHTYYIYTSTAQNSVFGSAYVVVTTTQESLNSTISVIQIQLLVVSLVMLVISFLLSMFISKRLADPIIEMSAIAKKWADGDENASFYASGYQELKELADALNYAKEVIARTGGLQRDLLANVSHDLKTPLTMIKSYAEMIRDISGSDKQKRTAHTQVIIDEADRLTALVNDILELSKLQNDINALNLAVVDLSSLCLRVVSRFEEFAAKDGYTLKVKVEKCLYAKVDEKKIEQVIYNLIGNSINYTGADKTVVISLTKEGDKIVFRTIDSGKGISQEKVKSIWEKYYRDSETHQRPIKGTGLGLSIVKTILESHNLRFGVISKKDVGSNFFIEFIEVEHE